jgi:hypothetical protein
MQNKKRTIKKWTLHSLLHFSFYFFLTYFAKFPSLIIKQADEVSMQSVSPSSTFEPDNDFQESWYNYYAIKGHHNVVLLNSYNY